MTIAGGTGSGKTYWLKNLISDQRHCLPKPFGRILYCYSIYQPMFDEMLLIEPRIEFYEGLPKEQLENVPDFGSDINALIVLDDLVTELANDEDLTKLFCRFSHHAYLNCIFVTQNFFHEGKEIRNVTRNSHYLVFTKSPRVAASLQTINRQIFPGKKNYLIEAYQSATKKRYGYLLIDLHPATQDKLRVREGIFEREQPMAYLPR